MKNPSMTSGGDREAPGGDASRHVTDHGKAARFHQEHGKGKNEVVGRAPDPGLSRGDGGGGGAIPSAAMDRGGGSIGKSGTNPSGLSEQCPDNNADD